MFKLSAISYQQSAISYQQSAISNQQSAISLCARYLSGYWPWPMATLRANGHATRTGITQRLTADC
ncbi:MULTISPECIES: hypothetical protein [Moorena]|uniref:Uncharacterized protein n=1 Tax=Moorena producens (strain JHB) TaxID=1454205 RepID=A0A1D9G181_MOOP1|nr:MULTISPECIES: hypothetical protein [Moorena]AOY81379.1 hypothetical protein BJP36_17155 [Moorena producens JHB]NER86226.1 hypothetical protein [Moorena sp. SIO3A2]